MSTLHSMKKRNKEKQQHIQSGYVCKHLGSVIICGYILSENKPDPVEINKTLEKIKKNPEKYIKLLD